MGLKLINTVNVWFETHYRFVSGGAQSIEKYFLIPCIYTGLLGRTFRYLFLYVYRKQFIWCIDRCRYLYWHKLIWLSPFHDVSWDCCMLWFDHLQPRWKNSADVIEERKDRWFIIDFLTTVRSSNLAMLALWINAWFYSWRCFHIVASVVEYRLNRQTEYSITPFLLGTDINRKVSFQAFINGTVYNDIERSKHDWDTWHISFNITLKMPKVLSVIQNNSRRNHTNWHRQG